MDTQRQYSGLDRLIMRLDQGLGTVFGDRNRPARENPAADVGAAEDLDPAARCHSAGLMRVNHAGEVSAQALYQGQGLAASDVAIKAAMQQAADEENDHLVWCEQRLRELDSHTSYLNPLWYLGSFSLGAAAGLCGDRWSLGFVAETERQVVAHLESHLDRLPAGDERSRRILEQMRVDEARHGHQAVAAGAATLPSPIRLAMRMLSRVMTTTAYRI